jgi:hypothetical protein
MKLVQQLLHHRNRELVFDRRCVESPIVDAESPGLVTFLDQEHRRGEG